MAAPAGDASTRLELITLEHPKSTHLTKYLLSKGGARLFEVQESTPKVPASFFIDNSVKKDPTVHMITAVDPLFLALPLLEKSSAKFSPLDQILMSENAPQTVQLRGCKNLLLDKVCDVNGTMIPIVCNF
jgi:ribonuclease H2 subunit B